MPIALSSLREAAKREPKPASRTISEARARGAKTVFVCHSHRDADLVKGLVNLLLDAGWTAYIDWADERMPAHPNRETARRIQERIVALDVFLFLATPNSLASRWCPWELGFANGKKQTDSIVVCATSDGGTIHGNEYLDLYRRLDLSSAGKLAVWRPGDTLSGIPIAQL